MTDIEAAQVWRLLREHEARLDDLVMATVHRSFWLRLRWLLVGPMKEG